MTGLEIFAAVGALAIATPPAAPERQAQLGVTATVVRPAEISAVMARPGLAVVTIANSPGILVAEPGTVGQADGKILVTVPGDTGSTTITVTY